MYSCIVIFTAWTAVFFSFPFLNILFSLLKTCASLFSLYQLPSLYEHLHGYFHRKLNILVYKHPRGYFHRTIFPAPTFTKYIQIHLLFSFFLSLLYYTRESSVNLLICASCHGLNINSHQDQCRF